MRISQTGLFLALLAFAWTPIVTVPAAAQGVTVIKRLGGLQCMLLDDAAEAASSQNQLPPVLSAPSPDSPQLGYPSGIVLVRSPLHEVNGYVEMVRINGQSGWISAEHIQPWHTPSRSSARCYPVLLSNGRYGTDIH